MSYVVEIDKDEKENVPELVEGLPAIDVSFSLLDDDRDDLRRLSWPPRCELGARATEHNSDMK